jgi:hypothetical protein
MVSFNSLLNLTLCSAGIAFISRSLPSTLKLGEGLICAGKIRHDRRDMGYNKKERLMR